MCNETMKQTYLEVYFTEESGLLDLRIDYKKIISVKIADGLLKIHDRESASWHCYNMNSVKHIHYPDNKGTADVNN